MSRDTSLSATVVFDLLGFDGATRLCELLGSERQAWVQRSAGGESVAVVLRPGAGDLAALLRTVEHWVAEHALGAIRLELDGRTYILESGDTIWSTAA